jgi:hypothetical protein
MGPAHARTLRLSRASANALLLAAAGIGQPMSAATITGDVARQCKTASTPSTTVVTCLGFGLSKGDRISGCAADESCIGTSAVNNPSKYGPPWKPSNEVESADPSRAWRSVVAAVAEQPDLKIVEQDNTRRYMRATGPSAVPTDGTDDVEFVLRDGGDLRLLYRSATRQAVYVYPLQQPIANQESHQQRLSAIRARLGWEEAGLPSDGKDLGSEMSQRYGVPTAKRWFGLEMGGMRVLDDDEYND